MALQTGVLFIISMNEESNTCVFQETLGASYTIWVLAIRLRGGTVLSLRYILGTLPECGASAGTIVGLPSPPAPSQRLCFPLACQITSLTKPSFAIPCHCSLRIRYHCCVPVLPQGFPYNRALWPFFNPEGYGEGYSVLLFVLQHKSEAHNRLTPSNARRKEHTIGAVDTATMTGKSATIWRLIIFASPPDW